MTGSLHSINFNLLIVLCCMRLILSIHKMNLSHTSKGFAQSKKDECKSKINFPTTKNESFFYSLLWSLCKTKMQEKRKTHPTSRKEAAGFLDRAMLQSWLPPPGLRYVFISSSGHLWPPSSPTFLPLSLSPTATISGQTGLFMRHGKR